MYCLKCGAVCEDFTEGENIRQKCVNCGYIYYRNPYPCIAVLIVNSDGEVLLGKRHETSIYPGRFCLPCGYIEYDETYVEAAIREVKEEAGIDIFPKGIINVVSNHFGNGINSLVIVMLAEYEGRKEPEPGDDITEVGWFSIEDMNKLPPLAFSADEFIIAKYKKMKESGDIFYITLEGSSSSEKEKTD